MRAWLVAFAAALWLAAAGAVAQDVQPVPALTAHVLDTTDTLSPAQRQALEDRLSTLERRRGTQLVVLMVATTQPEDIAAYAQRVGDQWKIGRRGIGDGLLIVVAKDDRRLRIEVAKALEGAVPDLAARRVIGEHIAPAFKRGDYAGGLMAAVDRLEALIQGEGLPEPAAAPPSGPDFDLTQIAILVLVAAPILATVLASILGRPLGALAAAGVVGVVGGKVAASVLIGILAGVLSLIVALVSAVLGYMRSTWNDPAHRPGTRQRASRHGHDTGWGGFGGGFGGGGASGGFGSGGGGDFGGGGASGDW